MHVKRDLAQNVWYQEPVFRLPWAVVLFCRVLIEVKGRFPFEMRGLAIGDEWLSFSIKPADGYELPKITRWMKQPPRSFSVSASFQIMKQIRWGGGTGPSWPTGSVQPYNLEIVHSGVTAEAHKDMAQAVKGKVAPHIPLHIPLQREIEAEKDSKPPFGFLTGAFISLSASSSVKTPLAFTFDAAGGRRENRPVAISPCSSAERAGTRRTSKTRLIHALGTPRRGPPPHNDLQYIAGERGHREGSERRVLPDVPPYGGPGGPRVAR